MESQMFESTATARTRDALRAAHDERGRFLAESLRHLLGRSVFR